MRKIGKFGGNRPVALRAYCPPVTPHTLLFLLYNFIYFMPLVSVYLWGYGEDGAANTLSVVNAHQMAEITWLYLAGIMSFVLGTKTRDVLQWCLGGRPRSTWTPSWFDFRSAETIAMWVLILSFLTLKIALAPLGAYQSYSFDSGAMLSGTWGASMFTSEAMLLAGVLVLFSKAKHNVALFLIVSSLNGINLLHGTRVFFIITIMVGITYAYIRGRLPIWRIIVFGPLAFSGVLISSYAVFLVRSSVSTAGAFTVERILSPVVYESVFSQMSLVSLVTNSSRWSAMGHLFSYFGDVFLFTIPRFLLPEKGNLLYHSNPTYADLSPMGAFSGYADGLVYFGLLFPAFYFSLGLVASWLYRRAQKNSWWFVLYVYFSADFLFRIMRDGYLIPSKMLINMLEILCALILWRPICTHLLNKRPSIVRPFSSPPFSS